MSTLADEVELIHTTLEKRGANSRRVQAIDGSTFDVPVDADHKATVLKLTSIANPLVEVGVRVCMCVCLCLLPLSPSDPVMAFLAGAVRG